MRDRRRRREADRRGADEVKKCFEKGELWNSGIEADRRLADEVILYFI
jgi:hypothetical protein